MQFKPQINFHRMIQTIHHWAVSFTGLGLQTSTPSPPPPLHRYEATVSDFNAQGCKSEPWHGEVGGVHFLGQESPVSLLKSEETGSY